MRRRRAVARCAASRARSLLTRVCVCVRADIPRAFVEAKFLELYPAIMSERAMYSGEFAADVEAEERAAAAAVAAAAAAGAAPSTAAAAAAATEAARRA